MKKLLSILALALAPSVGFAAPFIKSTTVFPTAEVTHFEVIVDGAAPVQSTPFSSGGGVILRHDIAGIADGSHTVTAKACNVWGCGTSSPVLNFQSGTGSINWTGTLVIQNN